MLGPAREGRRAARVRLLGGRRQASFPLYIAVPLGPADAMAAYVQARRAEGIHHFQLKLGADPHDDAARVRAVLEATRTRTVIADANGGWRLQDAVVAARLLEGLDRVLLRAAVPDARGVPLGARADDAPDGARRGHHRRRRCSRATGRHGSDQPEDLRVGGLTRARQIASSPRRSACGSRSRTRGAATSSPRPSATSLRAPAGRALHGVVHERLDERAHRRLRAALARRRRAAPTGPGLGVEVDVEMLGAPLFSCGATQPRATAPCAGRAPRAGAGAGRLPRAARR